MNRRRFLTLLGVSTASGLAGCGGLGGTGSTETETIQETPNNSTINPAHGTSTPTSTPTPEPTPTPTPTETEVQETEQPSQDLTGREIYLNQIHGEDEGVLERVQGTGGKTSISFQAIDESLEEGFEQGGRFEAVKSGLETASKQYSGGNHEEGYWNRHRHIMSALHQTLEQKQGEQWDFEVDSRLDAQPGTDGWLKFSRIDVEKEGETTERGNTEYQTIRGALDERYQHTTHISGNPADPSNYVKRILQQVDNPESVASRSLIDKDAADNAIEHYDWNRERSYDQASTQIGILLGGGLDTESSYENTSIAPENLLVAEEGREEEILEIVDEYEEDGDLALRQRMREEYFNNGHEEYEASTTNITADGSVSMEGIDDFDMSNHIADA
ncbi:hypothetical protein [Haloarcula hispanica]|uniref:hypothetical protein n=1 Tax=Haloarcula hispanica TaxID=51589 RepID=UPI0011B50CC1|nr:hypothetical protein [Haloarcula hispanica]